MEKKRSSFWFGIRIIVVVNFVIFSLTANSVLAQPVQFGEQPNGSNAEANADSDEAVLGAPADQLQDKIVPLPLVETNEQTEVGREPSSVGSPALPQKTIGTNVKPGTPVMPSAASLPQMGSLVPISTPTPSANGSGLVERVYHAQMKSDSANSAKKKMIEEAIAKTSEAVIQEIIGPVRFQKSKNDIQNKLMKQTGRFIPVMKTGEIGKDAEGNFTLAVTMQVSLKTLELILKEQGLLYEMEATPIILPMVNYIDQVQNKSYRWWRSIRDADQGQQYSNLEKYLQRSFGEQGFYVERPNGTGLELLRPSVFDKDNFTPEDWTQLAQLYKVSAFIEGDIRVVVPPGTSDSMGLEIQLLARQVSTGKVLAELYRKGQWDKRDFWNQKRVQQWVDSTFKDLAVQVKESWQRGTFSSSVLKLIVKGGLPLSRFQKFKDQIQSQSRLVRQIRERVIGADELVFDIDVTGNTSDLSSQLQTVIFDDQKFQLFAADAGSITLSKGPR
jgi:hypothetical protein